MEKLGWEPLTTLREGIAKTYEWIKSCIEDELSKSDIDISKYASSTIVSTV